MSRQVVMLRDVLGAGGVVMAAESTQTLDDAFAAGLVASGRARPVGGAWTAPGSDAVRAVRGQGGYALTTPDGVTVLTAAQGAAVQAGIGLVGANRSTGAVAAASLADYTFPSTAPVVLSLPNPYPSQANAPTHASLLSLAEPFGGYAYWLAFTPYPSYVSDYENPCVVASNDLLTWVAPAANPLVAKPSGTAYNADPHLFMDAAGTRMYLAFRERGVAAANNLKVMHTDDGVQWSAPVTILTGTVGSQDFGSPSIWWNGTGWTLISSNLDAAAPWPLQRRVSSSADVYGAWGSAATVTMAPPSGRAWWHTCFSRVSDGRIIGVAQDNNQTSGSSGTLYLVESGDEGLTFSVLAPIWTSGGKYRSGIAARQVGAEMHLDLVLADYAALTLSHVRAKPVAQVLRLQAQASLAAILAAATNLPPGVVWADTCVRADSAATPSPATSGGNYTVSSGTWGIDTNRLYPVASGRLFVAAGTPQHEISAQVVDMTTSIQQWLIVRGVDGSNYYRVGVVSPTASGAQTLAVQKIVAGFVVQTWTIGNITRGDLLTVAAAGALLRVSVNGALAGELVMDAHAAGAQAGIQANAGASTRYRNVVVRSLL